jgi:hypothetical protein
MSSKQSIWYRLGFSLEQARLAPTKGSRTLAGLKERSRPAPKRARRSNLPASWPSGDDLIVSGAVAVIAKALDVWRPRKKTGILRILKSGAAGAGAALLTDLGRVLLTGRSEGSTLRDMTVERLLAGAGQGLVYGIVVEPRIPGPALLKGAMYGTAEYAVDPVGGMGRLLGPHAPIRRAPVVAQLLEGVDIGERGYVEHVSFGIALALLYGSSPSSNGMEVVTEE